MRSLLLTCAFALSAIAAIGAERWKEFKDPGGNFTVEFPRAPRAQTVFPSSTYWIDSDVGGMFAIDTVISAQPADPVIVQTQILEMQIKNLVTGATRTGGKLQSDMPDSLDGQSGRRLSVLRGDGFVNTYRLFHFNGHSYTVYTAVHPGSTRAQNSDADHFLLSLHFPRHSN